MWQHFTEFCSKYKKSSAISNPREPWNPYALRKRLPFLKDLSNGIVPVKQTTTIERKIDVPPLPSISTTPMPSHDIESPRTITESLEQDMFLPEIKKLPPRP